MSKGSPAEGETEALKLPLVKLPKSHPCSACGQCCTYVAVEIDNPSAPRDYDNIHWYLTHRGVSVYVDWEGDWYIEFETVCEHLSSARTCGIYLERPRMCSDFSWDECEKATQESAWKRRFDAPDDLFAFMRERRPRHYERYTKAREKWLAERGSPRPKAKGTAKKRTRGAGSRTSKAAGAAS